MFGKKLLKWLTKNVTTIYLLAGVTLLVLVFVRSIPPHVKVAGIQAIRTSEPNWERYWKIQNEDAWHWKGPEKYLVYVKDKRTNLCFAIASPHGQGGFMASVPCEKVEKYLEKIDG